MADDTKLQHLTEVAEEAELLQRRDFLKSLKRWSQAVIGGIVLGEVVSSKAEAGAWVNHGRAWANHGAAWANRGGGGGTWANRGGGGGGGAAWANRAGGGAAWANHGRAWANHGGGWLNAR